MGVAALLAAATLAVTPASYVASRQQADGGFAETGSRSTAGLTAWAMLGLRSAGQPIGNAYDYLVANERDLQSATDIELALIAEAATGRISDTLYSRFAALDRPDGRSEEHTSELQSHSDLVCRLLLEKKKKKRTQAPIHSQH